MTVLLNGGQNKRSEDNYWNSTIQNLDMQKLDDKHLQRRNNTNQLKQLKINATATGLDSRLAARKYHAQCVSPNDGQR